MDNNLNIFEKENLVKDAEVIKKDIKKGKKFRNIIVRGISLAAAISIFMSSIAFAGEHTVDNWEDYKRAIVQDIMKQDTLIKIEYNGKDVFQGNDLNEKVVSLYQDAIKTIKGTVGYENILKTLPDRKYSKNIEDRTYSLISGEYEMVYKNSAEDMKEVLATVRNTLNEIITKDMSDYEKVRAVYDFVIDSYRYENFAKDHNDTENIIKERNMLLGLKGHGVVCEAYAMLFSTMVTELGYDNIIVSGIVDGTGHAWNLIKINNQWYHVDPTWGDVDIRGIVQDFRESNPDTDENLIWEVAQQFADETRDFYFLTSDSVMRDERHSWDNSYPSAPEIYNIDAEKDKQEDKELELEKQMKKRIQELESKVEDVDNLADIQNLKNSIYELENEVNCLKNNNLKEELKANLSDLLSVLDKKEIQILEEQKKKELEELVGKANEAVILAENTLGVENVNIARELVLDLRNKEVDENIVTSLLNRLDEVEEKIQKEDNNSVEEPKEPSTEQENPDVEEPAIEEPTAEEPKDNQDNDGVGDNQQEPDVETPEEPEEPMDKDETPEDEEPKIDNPSTEEPEEEPAMEKPKANNPETVTKAVYLVEKAEETKLEEDIIVAEGFVQEELNNGEIKEELVNRLTSLKASLGLDNQQDQEDNNKDDSGVEDNPKEPEGENEEPEEPQEPDVEEPTMEEPMDDDMDKEETPKDEEPTLEEPVTEDPIIEEPITEEPVVEEPVVEEPTHDDLQDQIEQPQEPTIEEPIAKPKDDDTVIDNKESEMEKPVTTPEEDKDVDTDTTNSDKPVIEEPVTEKPTKDLGEKDNKVEKPVQSKDDSTKNNQSVEDKQNSSNHLNDNDTKSSSIEEEAEEDDDDDEDDEDTSMEENKVENNKEKESKLEKEKQQVQRNKMSKQKIEEVKTILKVVANANAKITVEGKDVKSDVKPYIYKEKEDKILLPIRFVAEALGFDVKWSKATWDKGIRKVFLSKEGKGIVMGIDETSYYVNGKAFKADIAPQLKDGRTYVSMDFLIEVLEIEFDYQNNGGAIEFKIN